MPATEKQIEKFAVLFKVTQKTAENCLVFLEALPQFHHEQFRNNVMKFDERFREEDVMTYITVKEWLDTELGIEDAVRRNKWSQKKSEFWQAILEPNPLGKALLEQFVRVYKR